ncbi:hypothetical protein MMC22_004306 [Lobaria immixta]|nr:hypothetical protein [Lobaria immixta]
MANGSALSEYESYLSTVWNNCTSVLGVDFDSRTLLSASVLVPASTLTITSTSFTSLARSIVANQRSSVEEETLISRHGDKNAPAEILAKASALTPASAPTITSTPFTSLARNIGANRPSSVEGETLTSRNGDKNAPAEILAKASALTPASAPTITSTPFTSLARNIGANRPSSVEGETLISSGGDKNAPARMLAKTSALTPDSAPAITSTSITSLTRSIGANRPSSVEEETLTSSGGDQNAPAMILAKTSALTPASAPTRTSTSFTSLARSISVNRSPSEKTQNPLALTTTPINSQNAPGKSSSKPLNSLNSNLSGNLEPNSPSPTSVLPAQIGFKESNSPELDSPINSALTLASPQRSSLPRLTLDSSIITANSVSQFVIDGQTLRPGGPEITLFGTPLTLAPSATDVVIAGTPVKLAKSPLPILTLPGRIITPNSESQYLIGDQTLVPGSIISVSGTFISLAPSGSIAVALIASATPLPPLTLDGTTILPNSASEYLIGSQTLNPGAPAITISGTRISLAPSAYAVVVGSETFPITSGPTTTTSLPLITIGNSVITPNAASKYIIAGQTLAPGDPAIIISGTRISILPQATGVIVGASTERLSRPTLVGVGSTTPASLNGSASATGPAALQGGATRVYGRRWISAILIFGMGLWGWS